MNAPVIVFTFKRIDTLKLIIQAISNNVLSTETDLILFSDAPHDEMDTEAVQIVRKYLRTITGFKSVTVIEREHNYGLARNIAQGVTTVLQDHEKVIVLEDDIVVAPFFLAYMNDALNLYRDDEKVCQIAGYSYLQKLKGQYDLPETYFIRGGDCLAWGTWRRAWAVYSDDAEALAAQIRSAGLIRKFNRDNYYNYYRMLCNTASGKTVSWAIKWYAANFLQDRYVLYPLKSLALHIGTESSATNYKFVGLHDPYEVPLYNSRIKVERLEIYEMPNVGKAYNAFLSKTRGSLVARIHRSILAKFKRLLYHYAHKGIV
jgi:hypothetical protein